MHVANGEALQVVSGEPVQPSSLFEGEYGRSAVEVVGRVCLSSSNRLYVPV